MRFLSLLLASSSLFPAARCAAGPLIVENGQARAEIVISDKPLRMVRVAAHELREQIEKMSGARLPIVTQPTGKAARLFVGRSPHTDALGISAGGLKDGAYRLVSGPDWLVFLGQDTEFVPTEPWAKNNADIVSGKTQREWDAITGEMWGGLYFTMYKHRLRLPGDWGKPDGGATSPNEFLDLWGFDERGSFNAVSAWLESLGMRWYLPGELGQITPELKSIPLPKIDATARPDFSMRKFNFRFSIVDRDTSLWAMRLGTRDPWSVQVAHGMEAMTGRNEIFDRHPNWFALYGGKRHYTPDYSKNQLCYSNDELFEHTVRYARALFDHYPLDTVSIMPPDGYTAICQCEKCAGKDSPERDNRGLLSDYVWDFVNRVAKEVGKTHPGKRILNCAYGVYTLPPQKIDQLEPNVQVCIVGGRRPLSDKPEEQAEVRALREAWAKKSALPLLNFENYPFLDRNWYLPAFFTGVLGDGVNASKTHSEGEDISLTILQDFHKRGIGFNHFLVYFTAKMYWGGPERDIRALFAEYCRLFYGPAEREMLAFFEYCEKHWREMEKDKAPADAALALFEKAKAKVPSDSIYGRRVALIDDFLTGLRQKSTQLGRKRGLVPTMRLGGDPREPISIDGRLDEPAWTENPPASTGSLRELQTGRVPAFGTTFMTAWRGDDLYVGIRCDERPGEKPNNTATKKDDSAIWYGDAIEVILETESHSYYQIAVSPSGAVVDLDRGAPRSSWFTWDSQAEVATHIADDHWTVEMRLPITPDANDPLHQVVGRKPTPSLPWFLNVCRQRVRGDGTEASAYSPTGTDGFHVPLKFARFYYGRSGEFDAAEDPGDFLVQLSHAAKLPREEAVAAYAKIADGSFTDLQKSHALEQATAAARVLRRFEEAEALTARIPLDAVKKAATMRTLLDRFQAPALISQFAGEDVGSWPFWKRAEGHLWRGQAYQIGKDGAKAESDFAAGLLWAGDPRLHDSLQLALGQVREQSLKNDPGALEAYRAVLAEKKQIGGSDEYNAAQGMARVLCRMGRHEDALAALRLADFEKIGGFWRGSMLIALGDTQLAAGRKTEALAAYRAVLVGDSEPAHRAAAQRKIADLGD